MFFYLTDQSRDILMADRQLANFNTVYYIIWCAALKSGAGLISPGLGPSARWYFIPESGNLLVRAMH